MAWNPDENKLMYLAERKVKKSDPFWTSYARRKLDDPNANDKDNAERVTRTKVIRNFHLTIKFDRATNMTSIKIGENSWKIATTVWWSFLISIRMDSNTTPCRTMIFHATYNGLEIRRL